MRNLFVETENAKRFQDAISALEARGAPECRFIVIDGDPGLGKTKILEHYSNDKHWLYLRAEPDWTVSWFVDAALRACDVRIIPHKTQDRTNKLKEELGRRRITAEKSGQTFCIVIDEADEISRSRKVIEKMRSLADGAKIAFVLIGMGQLRDHLVRFPQATSRVTRYVEFQPMDVGEVRHFVDSLCQIPVAGDLIELIRDYTDGQAREIMEAIARIERFGYLNPPSGPDGMTVADMAGQVLVNDRKTSKPMLVQGV